MATDCFLECWEYYKHLNFDRSMCSCNQICCRLSSISEIDRFLDQMITRISNPFPGRKLHISFKRNMENFSAPKNHLWDKSIIILSTFGNHLHCLEIEISCNQDIFRRVLSSLALTPRLRFLYINYTDNALDALNVTKPLLPILKHLIVLWFRFIGTEKDLKTDFSARFQVLASNNYSSQLRVLKISLINLSESWVSKNVVHFPNLESLTMTVSDSKQLSIFGACESEANKKLKLVSITLKNGGSEDNNSQKKFSLHELISPWLRYRKSLEKFEIKSEVDLQNLLVSPCSIDMETLFKLQALKYLCIQGFVFRFVNILPFLPISLKELCLSGYSNSQWEEFVGVSFDIFNVDSFEMRCQLWETLSNLCMLTVYVTDKTFRYAVENDMEWTPHKRNFDEDDNLYGGNKSSNIRKFKWCIGPVSVILIYIGFIYCILLYITLGIIINSL